MSTTDRVPVAIGIGANLGDPRATIERALGLLAAGRLEDIRLSPLFETEPVDCDPGTPPFVNAALTAFWAAAPAALLRLTKDVEARLGRPPVHSQRQARSLDLDLVLFGDEALHTTELTVPHPRLCERRFVLAPLAEIAPDWIIPGTSWTVREALAHLEAGENAQGWCRRLA